MAKQLQLIYDEVASRSRELRTIGEGVRSHRDNFPGYASALEKRRQANEAFRAVKNEADAGVRKDLDRMEDLRRDVKVARQSMAVRAVSEIADGGDGSVKGKDGERLVPEFSVKFVRPSDEGKD